MITLLRWSQDGVRWAAQNHYRNLTNQRASTPFDGSQYSSDESSEHPKTHDRNMIASLIEALTSQFNSMIDDIEHQINEHLNLITAQHEAALSTDGLKSLLAKAPADLLEYAAFDLLDKAHKKLAAEKASVDGLGQITCSDTCYHQRGHGGRCSDDPAHP